MNDRFEIGPGYTLSSFERCAKLLVASLPGRAMRILKEGSENTTWPGWEEARDREVEMGRRKVEDECVGLRKRTKWSRMGIRW